MLTKNTGGNEYNKKVGARMAVLFPNAKIFVWEKEKKIAMKELDSSHHRRRGFKFLRSKDGNKEIFVRC